ncbi:RDD family protein [Belliella marina]|uniref:RDD family protein n=1 Tax=Belliella marina TaxID=1644146 RepID=A0ABW4VKL3_9BACT
MKEFQIKTAQNINIHQNTANVGSRILAYLLDAVFIFLFIVLAIFLGSKIFENSSFSLTFYTVMGLPILLYHLLFESLMDGQSPGKMVLQIRVVKVDGSKAGLGDYLIRWLLRIVDISFTSGGLAILSILISGKGQRIGDLAAGTTVISEKFITNLQNTLLVDLPENYVPKYSQAMILTDKQVQDIKQIKNEALKSGDFGLIQKLAAKTADLLQVTYEEKSLAFLDQVIRDYNFYSQQG